MNSRELLLLSPYRVPAKDSLMLGDEDMAAFLNGYTALWHPALIHGAGEPPKIVSPYDYESPTAEHVYALPETPQMFLPDDWEDRVRDVGAVSFRSSADRPATLANLREALASRKHERPEDFPFLDAAPEQLAPFFGIGFGYVNLLALFEAMDHENLLAGSEFWQDVQQAAAALSSGSEAAEPHLKAAADRLMAAREALYPTTIHVLDLCTLDELPPRWSIPAAGARGLPLNVIASGQGLESFFREEPEAAAALRAQVQADQAEVCVGSYREREDSLLPIESQIWNLLKGLKVARDILGAAVRVFARKRIGGAAQLPLLLGNAGLERALLVNLDEASFSSSHTSIVSNWSAPNGKQIEVFTRNPHRADAAATFFHAAYYLHQTIAQDFVATLALVHRGKPACPWYDDWLELTRFAPVLGRWTTISNYFSEVLTGEQGSMSSADEFQADHLTERSEGHVSQPVSWFARHTRSRRRLDTLWTMAALHQGLAGNRDTLGAHARLQDLEDRVETCPIGESEGIEAAFSALQTEIGGALAERLLARATASTPGYLVLNPCNFIRRVALEVDVTGTALPVAGPLKACQIEAGRGRLVVEVPPLGFAWVPRAGAAGTAATAKRIRLADERHVRNEFFEAEIDPATGGLRGIWDPRSHVSRVGQMLVYNPGSTMRASSIQVTSTGPALGEVVSEGAILGDEDRVLAKFRQRFRAWLGRPVLEMRIEIYPEQAPTGYPWHAYFGARFAWRDERTLLLRGVNGTGTITSHTRPESPDYLEWRLGRQSTTLFPGGLPFHQRHGARMLDVILVPEGEECKVFELALGLDRDYPMQTALSMVTPVPVIPVAKGPPHIGAAGWLFHLDATNLLLTSMRPATDADAVQARILECALHSTQAELRCVRNPQRAYLLDAHGENQSELSIAGDAALFDVSASDCVQLRVEFR